MNKSIAGQPVQYWHPSLQWLNMLIDCSTEEAQLHLDPVGIILMACVLLMIVKYFTSKAKFRREKDQLVAEIQMFNNIIAGLRDKNEMHVRMYAITQYMHACILLYVHKCAMTIPVHI